MNNNHYIDFVLDILSPLGNIKTRKMFGSYGIYKDDIFFALVVEDILYFKVDDSNRQTYESYGSKPFTYEGKNKKTVAMGYWQVPADILEDHSQLTQWVNQAVLAARRAKKSTL